MTKILIVEDDFMSRNILQKLLVEYGEAHMAVNGTEAVNAVKLAYEGGKPYELICLDIMMPGITGVEALRQIRDYEEARGIYTEDQMIIVMTTAVDGVSNIIEAFKNLCDGYITKPLSKLKLETELGKYGFRPLKK